MANVSMRSHNLFIENLQHFRPERLRFSNTIRYNDSSVICIKYAYPDRDVVAPLVISRPSAPVVWEWENHEGIILHVGTDDEFERFNKQLIIHLFGLVHETNVCWQDIKTIPWIKDMVDTSTLRVNVLDDTVFITPTNEVYDRSILYDYFLLGSVSVMYDSFIVNDSSSRLDTFAADVIISEMTPKSKRIINKAGRSSE